MRDVRQSVVTLFYKSMCAWIIILSHASCEQSVSQSLVSHASLVVYSNSLVAVSLAFLFLHLMTTLRPPVAVQHEGWDLLSYHLIAAALKAYRF